MNSTEDYFEGRFLTLFHCQEDLPSPDVKSRELFVYPSHHKGSIKRRAPAPPDQTGATEVNSYLININNLGPVLKKYATLPRKSSDIARVILTTDKSKLKTSSSTSGLRSMFKSNLSFSTKMDQGMFRSGPCRKNKPTVDHSLSNDVLSYESDNLPPCSRGNGHSGNISHVRDFSKTQTEINKGKVGDNCGNPEREDNLNLNNQDVLSSLDTNSDPTVGKELSVQADNQALENSVHVNTGFPEKSYTSPSLRNPTSQNTASFKSKSYSCLESSPPRGLSPKSVSPSRKHSPTRGLGSRVNMKEGASQASMATVSHETHSNEADYHTVNNFTQKHGKCSLNMNGYFCDTDAENKPADDRRQSRREKTASLFQSQLPSPELKHGILTKNTSQLGNFEQVSIHPKNTFEKPDSLREMKCSDKEFPPYYVKQNPIYEEVDMTLPPVQHIGNSKAPSYHRSTNVQPNCHDDNIDVPPAPANSPVILNKASPRKKKSPPPKPPPVLNTQIARKKKTPPPKPPRKRSIVPETGTENAPNPISLILSLENHQKTSIGGRNDIQVGGNYMKSETGGHIAQDVTQKLEQYYFGESLERHSPKKPHISSCTSSQPESIASVPSLVIEPSGSHPHKMKQPKKSRKSKAHALSKSFRYLLVTKFGNFKLTGTTYFSKCNEAPSRHSRCSKRASFLSLRERMRPRSPTPKRVNSIRIPRVVIDCEQSGWEGGVHSTNLDINSVNENEKEDMYHSSATLCITPNAKVETDCCSTEEECHEKFCSLCTSLSLQEQYNKDEEEYGGFLSKSNQNPCYKICSQSPEKKTRLC